MGILVSSAQKNVFREDLSHKDLEIIWNGMQIQGEKNHLHILDMELEKHKSENILLIGDFNSRNKIWDGNANRMGRMCLIL